MTTWIKACAECISVKAARCSHVMVRGLSPSADVRQYMAAVDASAWQRFFRAPLFEIVDVIPGVEDGEDGEDELLSSLAFAARG